MNNLPPQYSFCSTCTFDERCRSSISVRRRVCIPKRKSAPSHYVEDLELYKPKEHATLLPERILLIGEMGAGKDTVAELLKDHQREAFGDLIKDLVKWIRKGYIGMAYYALKPLFKDKKPEDLMRRLKEFKDLPKVGPKDRLLLQELGTYCRLHKNDIWMRPILDNLKEDQKYVITDCRRQDEFDACLRRGFIPVAVCAFESIRKDRLIERDKKISIEEMSHTAEREIQALIPQCHAFVYNNGSKEDLQLELNTLKVRKGESTNENDF
ncbi:hypothetical protein SPFL3102_03563 [Sporomusaceae bacterium FL31]|nr:hypothetical protein SPFL3101_00442 [Sporomusaceae bacterium FL31]GCE35712.1 hypothetical protein SPFL3102_03563 [Sporomusaceae bacterium]